MRTKNLADSALLRAKLKVKVNHGSALRKIAAFKKFCDEKYEPELLDPIRLAFLSDPSNVPHKQDLTKGPAHSRSNANAKLYKSILGETKGRRQGSQSQVKALMTAANMRRKMVVVQGPPGEGKTRTLRDKIIALKKIGHKVLCVASSNAAVNTDADAIWQGLSPDKKKMIKCLRLETEGAEKAQRLAKVAYANYTGEDGEADQQPAYFGLKDAQDHPAIRNGLDKLCYEFTRGQQYDAKAMKDYEDVNKAYSYIQNFENIKLSNVSNGMTLDYCIWEIREQDRTQAEVDYNEARNRLTPEEYHRQLESGEMSLAKFDRSREYQEHIANYKAKKGKITGEEKKALNDVTDKMITRVSAETDILFSLASNCGGPLLEDNVSFVPTAIFCDETG